MLSTSWRSKGERMSRMTDRVLMWDPYTTSVTGVSRIYSSCFPPLSLRLLFFLQLSFLCHMRCTQHTENSKPSSLHQSTSESCTIHSVVRLQNDYAMAEFEIVTASRAGIPVPSNILNTKIILILNHLQIQIKYISRKKKQKQQIKS